MHVSSDINEHPTFYSKVWVYVCIQKHKSGVCNIKINVFLAEHRKTEENGFRELRDKKMSFKK